MRAYVAFERPLFGVDSDVVSDVSFVTGCIGTQRTAGEAVFATCVGYWLNLFGTAA